MVRALVFDESEEFSMQPCESEKSKKKQVSNKQVNNPENPEELTSPKDKRARKKFVPKEQDGAIEIE